MKTIYLMRHGRTLFNVMGLNQGMSDSPLTKEGIEETLKTKEWFIDNKVAFDSVYASTLKRACDTTELVTDMPYQRYQGLEEIFIRQFHNKSEPSSWLSNFLGSLQREAKCLIV